MDSLFVKTVKNKFCFDYSQDIILPQLKWVIQFFFEPFCAKKKKPPTPSQKKYSINKLL